MSTISGSDRLEVQLAPGDLIAQWDPELVVEIEAAQFNTAPHTHVRVAPRNGHHYPIRALRGIPQDVSVSVRCSDTCRRRPVADLSTSMCRSRGVTFSCAHNRRM